MLARQYFPINSMSFRIELSTTYPTSVQLQLPGAPPPTRLPSQTASLHS